MDPRSDNALMMKVKHGDLDKLGLLFERYHRRLYGFFYRLTYRNEISEDLVQGVFERILKYRQTYSDGNEFSAWLFGIARNLHADYYQKTKVSATDDSETNWELIPAEDSGAEFYTDENMDKLLLRKALDRLDHDKKQVLILSRFEGFKYKEIATIMNCTESAVKVRVFRALNELKNIICTIRKQDKL